MFRHTCSGMAWLLLAVGCGAGEGDGSQGTSSGEGTVGSTGSSSAATTSGPGTGTASDGPGSTSAATSGDGGTTGPGEDDLEWDEVPSLDCGDQGHAVLDSGAGSNRVNLVILGDGYTRAELGTTYVEHVDRMLDEMFGEDLGLPYDLYRGYFNICRIDIVSNESGVDIPDENVYVDTALDGWGSDDTRLGLVDIPKFNAALQAAMATANITVDLAAVTLNTDRWFNSGGYPMIWSGGTSPVDVAVHEGGHTFHNLADEYGGDPAPYDGPEPGEVNVTADPTGMKWDRWIGFDQDTIGEIGTFEGGRYHDVGIWRPSANAKMNLVPERHSAPSVEKIIMDIYEIVRPIDDFSPKAAGSLPPALGVRVVDANRLQVDWYVDSALALEDGGTILDTSTLGLAAGNHEVEARVFDPTPWVRHEDRSSLEQSVIWPVEVQ